MAHTPTRVATLGEIRDHGDRLRAWCRGCMHHELLDLEALIARLGPDFHLADNRPAFVAALRCTRCGTKGQADIIHEVGQVPGTPGYRSR